jgi:O-antigen ligase
MSAVQHITAKAPALSNGQRPHDRPTRSRLEIAVGVALLVGSASALFPLLYGPTSLGAEEVAWLRYLWLPVYSVTVFLAVLSRRELKAAAPAFVPALALLALAGASALWSIDPHITLRRWEALAFNTLLAFYLAARFSWAELVRMVAAALLILALGSLAMAVGFPRLGIQSDANAGDWRGLWTQKNELGFNMVIGAQACLATALLDARRRLLWLAGAGLCFLLLVLSRSGTSLLCLIPTCGLLAALTLSKQRPVIGIIAVFIAGCAVLAVTGVVIIDIDLFYRAMGKDPTLTGRTDIWAAVMRRAAERPTLGYGYGAFWTDRFGPALLVRREAGWDVPAAHNGWLDVLLQLGWTGVGAAATYFALTAMASVRNLLSRGDGYWAVMYAIAFLILSFSESDILLQNSLEWILFLVVSTKLFLDLTHSARPAPARLKLVRAV